jgi:hypothetical protein
MVRTVLIRTLRRSRTVLALFAAFAVAGGLVASARADVPGPITSRVMGLLDTGTPGATTGMYLKQVGGPVIAAKNEAVSFEPASTIKVLIHLYAMRQVQAGNLALTDPVPMFQPPPPGNSCPGDTVIGIEPLRDALERMMRVSDNTATRELMEYFGVAALDDFAHNTLGLATTNFATTASPPGFNVIGCDAGFPDSLDGNTATLAELGAVYEGVADGSLLSGLARDTFYELMAGKQMYDETDPHHDFTGVWDKLLTMAQDEAPPGVGCGLSLCEAPDGKSELGDFVDAMTANTKGGGYGRCIVAGCSSLEQWLNFDGWVKVPACVDHSFTSTSYVWGIFVAGSVDDAYFDGKKATPADQALGSATAEPLREEIRSTLSDWGACFPPKVFVSTTPSAPGPGQAGYFNGSDLAGAGGAVKVRVDAFDDSGVSDLSCTDNAGSVPVGAQSGDGINENRTGSFTLASDGTHHVECVATDGATPANTGAMTGVSDNVRTIKIDATPPTVTCGPPPTFVLGGPGGSVSATVTDETSGPAAGAVSAPPDVSSAGPKTVLLTGHDNAGNSSAVACPYVVAYAFLGFDSPPLKATAESGSTIPVRFRLGDASGATISDSEAQGLAAACAVRIGFSAGTPSPNCASYNAGTNSFAFELKSPKGAQGVQTIAVTVELGGTTIPEGSIAITLT